jgi:putative tryptophan/tyrosine transport system substrate-binding protein
MNQRDTRSFVLALLTLAALHSLFRLIQNHPIVHRGAIIRAAAQYRVLAIYSRQYVQEGGLMSYGADTVDIFKRATSYIDRILKGTSPADLPAQAPAKFEIAINLRTAKAIGVDIPPNLLALADEVIE